MDINKLANDLTLQEVYFTFKLYLGLASVGCKYSPEEINIKIVSSLVYHNHPKLPLTKKDKKDKLLFPRRTRNKLINEYKVNITKTLK